MVVTKFRENTIILKLNSANDWIKLKSRLAQTIKNDSTKLIKPNVYKNGRFNG